MLAGMIAVAFVSKFGAAYFAARAAGEARRSAVTIGVCMKTRGLMELVVLNIGKGPRSPAHERLLHFGDDGAAQHVSGDATE